MNTDNTWIVIVLLVVILVGSNAMMFAMVRGMRGTKWDWINHLRGYNAPMEKQNRDLNELSERVRNLKKGQDDEPDSP